MSMRKQCATIDESVLGKQYLELFQLTEDDQQGGLRFEMDKRRSASASLSPALRSGEPHSVGGRKEGARNKAQG